MSTLPDLPLFEDDFAETGLVDPRRTVPRGVTLPETAVLCWFHEVVDALDAPVVTRLRSEAGPVAVKVVTHRGEPVAVVQPGVGAPMAAIVLEELVALGVRRAVGCGGAGALLPELVLGHAIVVDAAVRDEGTSAHYLPPARLVGADPAVVAALVATAEAVGVTHVVGPCWTTDAVFRETPSRRDRRVAEGCVAVEMEAAALFAVAAHRGVRYGHLLMAGDSLVGETWAHRGWTRAGEARGALFGLALDAALALPPG